MTLMSEKKHSGFTIVELLIVIVVIAILAAISIVAYSGIQQRAQNTKTITAVREWAQILRMYRADNGAYPSMASCLGSGYGRGFSGAEPSGNECRQDTASVGYGVNSAFMSLISEYIGGPTPTPEMVTAGSTPYPWYRGVMYVPGYIGTKDRIDFVLAGSSTVCPSVAGLALQSTGHVFASTNSVRCIAFFPDSPF